MEEITYQGETYRPITRCGYYATPDGKVLSMKSGKPTPIKNYSKPVGCNVYSLFINGKNKGVGITRICYAVQKGILLEEIPKGTICMKTRKGKYSKVSREALLELNREKGLRGKVVRDPLARIADLMENLSLQEQYHRTGNIRPLKRKVEQLKGYVIAYTISNRLVLAREEVREVVDEAVSIFLAKVCQRRVVTANIQAYLEGIVKKYHAKRCSLMECKLPDEDRFMPESLDEWE